MLEIVSNETATIDASAVYGPDYYASHCGPVPYARNDYWLRLFGSVADALVRSFAPRRVFDAGCAIGLLVESLWDRGVETHGRDISTWAISQVRADVRPWCDVGSIAEPVQGEFDLVTCIEVLEHMPEAEATCAIRTLAGIAPRVLFSSSPTDLDEPTHINVRPTAYWLALWAEAGFVPSVTHDAGYLAPHAYVLERSTGGCSARELVSFADRIRHRVALSQVGAAMHAAQAQLRDVEREKAALQSALDEAERGKAALQSTLDDAGREMALLQSGVADARRENTTLQSSLAAAEVTAAEREDRLRRQAEAAEAQLHLTRASLEVDHAELSVIKVELAATRGEAATLRHASNEAFAAAEAERQKALSTSAEHQVFVNSTTWRATRPLRRCASALPPPLRRRMTNGLRLVWWTISFRLFARIREHRNAAEDIADPPLPLAPAAQDLPRNTIVQSPVAEPAEALPAARNVAQVSVTESAEAPPATADAMLAHRFSTLSALPVFAVPSAGSRRLTIVTDSINSGSLYGGVGTALILGAFASHRLGASLRLVTRTDPPDVANVDAVLRVHGIPWNGSIELVYAPGGDSKQGRDVPASDTDLFLTTSWWTTRSTCQSVPRSRIAYLLQEDERMFYPLGDDYLRCAETISDPDLLYLVNTKLLLGHLRNEGLAPGATAFEPSFPEHVYNPVSRHTGGTNKKRRFFFYARPHNVRNLYWRGLEALSAAIAEGIFDPAEWDFYFAGHGAGPLSLPGGVRPLFPGPMAWAEYAALTQNMDIGLCLMYTPHPSYPPLDLAASGAVVVTNRFGPKRDLKQYSPNILCVDPDVPSLVAALRDAVTLADDQAARAANFARSGLQRDWATSLAPALDRLAIWAGV